tara:strand:- start:94 stop:618 length:525 start_codon:yes stop_codon:yes gene_type:complete
MNLKAELQRINLSDLRHVCKELDIYCNGNKNNVIKKLLEPLKQNYKIEMQPWKVIKEKIKLRKNATNIQKVARGYLARSKMKKEKLKKIYNKIINSLDKIKDIQTQKQVNQFEWKIFNKILKKYYQIFNKKYQKLIKHKFSNVWLFNIANLNMIGEDIINNKKKKLLLIYDILF